MKYCQLLIHFTKGESMKVCLLTYVHAMLSKHVDNITPSFRTIRWYKHTHILYTYTDTYTHIHILYTYTHIHILYTHTHTHTHTPTHIYYTHTQTHTYIYYTHTYSTCITYTYRNDSNKRLFE